MKLTPNAQDKLDIALNMLTDEQLEEFYDEADKEIKAIVIAGAESVVEIIDNDKTRDLAIKIVDALKPYATEVGYPFDVQDAIHEIINKHFKLKENNNGI